MKWWRKRKIRSGQFQNVYAGNREVAGRMATVFFGCNPVLAALAGSYAFLLYSTLFVNVCMVTGLVPVVGLPLPLPLPLMSYGGTAFLVHIVIIIVLVTAFRSVRTKNAENHGIVFRKRQHSRLKLLTSFFILGQLVVVFRLLYIYLT